MANRSPLRFELLKLPKNTESFKFGHVNIHRTQIFAKSRLSFAFTNIKPLLPGHSLVSPIRIVPRYRDLTDEELADFSSMIQVVAESLEKMYNCTSVSIAIQDGPDAGQTVSHVHAHIIPRKKFDMDDPDSIYSKLDNKEGSVKTNEEMEEIARNTESFIEIIMNSRYVGCLRDSTHKQ